jgi:hypothetical protein
MVELIIGAHIGDTQTREVFLRSFFHTAFDIPMSEIDVLVHEVAKLMVDTWSTKTIDQSVGTLPANAHVGSTFAEIKSVSRLKVLVLTIKDDKVYIPLISDRFLADIGSDLCQQITSSWSLIMEKLGEYGALSQSNPLMIVESTLDNTQTGKVVPMLSHGYFTIGES